jgi:hypothetical protein
MIDDDRFLCETWIRGAEEAPDLSPELRDRVLLAAAEAEARRVWFRRSLWATGLVVAACFFRTLSSSRSTDPIAIASLDASLPQVGQVEEMASKFRLTSGTLSWPWETTLVVSRADEWELVDAFSQMRRVRHRLLQRGM